MLDVVVIRLVDEPGHILGDAVEQLPYLLPRDHDTGEVVRRAEIDEANIAMIGAGGADQRGDVLAAVAAERRDDRLRVDARRVLVHVRERRLHPDALSAAGQERPPRDLQDLARARLNEQVLGFHPVVIGDGLDDVAVAVAVTVLEPERFGHRRAFALRASAA
jgi:hypothetical protein